MKNPRTSEAMFAITNKCALAEEVTLDTREQKKEKDSGHADKPSSCKGHDKQRKVDHSINMMNLKASWITYAFFTPKESTRPGTAADSKVSQIKYSRRPRGLIKRKSLKNLRVTSPTLTRRSTTSMVALILKRQGRSRISQPGRSWQSHPPPPSGLRSPSPSTAVITRTLFQSQGSILSLSTPSLWMSSSTESSSMEAAP
jgi:hypothetical protein